MITYIKKGAPQYKANLHCHSVLSDGKLTPEQLKEAYKSHGYSVLCITDHERPHDHTALSDPDFLMLTGYEAYIRPENHTAYGPEVHINLFARDPHNVKFINFEDKSCKYIKDPAERDAQIKVGSTEPREYTVKYVNDFVKTAKEHGYICSHNHAVWSMEAAETVAAYEGFFTMEMSNYSSKIINRMEYNGPLYDRLLMSGKRLFCHAADDNHNKQPFDSPECDSFGGFTMIMTDDLSYDSVFSALEKGNFYASEGPEILELTFDGNKVHIETTPARQITMLAGAKRTKRVLGTDDTPVTSADFEISDKHPYVRFDVYDYSGNHANTRAFFRDELGI
ncbi:MAG: hypothetical protein IJY27_07875 [Clostridia bacterium]|nr:hypothetical protein [Clostridia bacterium]